MLIEESSCDDPHKSVSSLSLLSKHLGRSRHPFSLLRHFRLKVKLRTYIKQTFLSKHFFENAKKYTLNTKQSTDYDIFNPLLKKYVANIKGKYLL